MKKLQLDFQIYKWLCALGVLKLEKKTVLHNKIELDDLPSRLLQNGILFSEFLQQIRPEVDLKNLYAAEFTEKLKDLKESNTPSTRLYNWNILNELMKQIGIGIDGEIKSMIVSGDSDMINEVFKDIYLQFKRNGSQRLLSSTSSPNLKTSLPQQDPSTLVGSTSQRQLNINNPLDGTSSPMGNSLIASQSPQYERNQSINTMTDEIDREEEQFSAYMTKMGQISQAVESDGAVNLNTIDNRKPLDQTTSLLEYFITGLCRHVGLQPKQSVALLSNGNKYLAHVMVKGVKSNFTPVVNWLKEIQLFTQQLVTFMEADNTNIQNVLNTIKPGLLSKNQETAIQTARVYLKIIIDLKDSQLLPRIFDWFSQMNGGLATFIMSIKRHRSVCEPLAQVITNIANKNNSIADILLTQLQKWMEFKHDYIQTVFWLFPFLVEKSNVKEELKKTQVIESWLLQIEAIIEDNIQNDFEFRRIAVMLLTDLWIAYPDHIEKDLKKSQQVLELIKKSTRDHSLILKFTSLERLFQLLQKFTATNNQIFPLIYKKLTFSFIENHADIEMREFFIRNFKIVFTKFPALPIEVLIQPLLKQIQVSQGHSYILNIIDIDFMRFVVKYPKISLKLAVQLSELLMHIYMEKVVFSRYIFDAVLELVSRFMKDQVFQDYMVRTARTTFALFVASAKASSNQKSGSKSNSISSSSSNKTLTSRQNQTEIINQQKRSLTIELYKKLLNMQSIYVNQQIKYIVANSYNQLKSIGQENKGLIALLSMFGSPAKVLEEVSQFQPEVRMSNENSIANDPEFIQFIKPGAIKSAAAAASSSAPGNNLSNIDPSKSVLVDSVTKSQLINNLTGSQTPKVNGAGSTSDDAFSRKFGIGYKQKTFEPINPKKKEELDEYFQTRDVKSENELRKSSLPRISNEEWKTMPLTGSMKNDNQRYVSIDSDGSNYNLLKEKKNYSAGVKSKSRLLGFGDGSNSMILEQSKIKNKAVLEKIEQRYMQQYIKQRKDEKFLQRKQFLDSQIQDIKKKRFEQISQKSVAERVQREHMTQQDIEKRENFKNEGSLLQQRLEDFHQQLEEKKQNQDEEKRKKQQQQLKEVLKRQEEVKALQKKNEEERKQINESLKNYKQVKETRSKSIEEIKGPLKEEELNEKLKELASQHQQIGNQFPKKQKEQFDSLGIVKAPQLRPWEQLTQKVEDDFKKKYVENIKKEIEDKQKEDQDQKKRDEHKVKNDNLSKAYAKLQLDREQFIQQLREITNNVEIKQVFGWVDPQSVKPYEPSKDKEEQKKDKKWHEEIIVPEYPENQESYRDVLQETFSHFIQYNQTTDINFKQLLNMRGFVAFCKVFQIIPQQVPQDVACHIFKASIREDMYNPQKDIANLESFIKSYDANEKEEYKNQIPAYKWYIKASALENEGMNFNQFKIALIRLAGKLKLIASNQAPATAPNQEIKQVDVEVNGQNGVKEQVKKWQIQYKPNVIIDDIKEIEGFAKANLIDFFTQIGIKQSKKDLKHRISDREIEREKEQKEKREVKEAQTYQQYRQTKISQDDSFLEQNQSFIKPFESPSKFQKPDFHQKTKEDRQKAYNNIRQQGQQYKQQQLQLQQKLLEKDFQYQDLKRKSEKPADPPPPKLNP